MFKNTGPIDGEGLGRSHVLYSCLWGIDFSTFKDGNNRGHLQPLQGLYSGLSSTCVIRTKSICSRSGITQRLKVGHTRFVWKATDIGYSLGQMLQSTV